MTAIEFRCSGISRAVLFCACLLTAGPGVAQTLFTDVTEEIGALLLGSRSTAFGDYDNDGWPDMFHTESVLAIRTRIALMHNEGNGRFANRTGAIEATVTGRKKGGGGIFGDYDNDGDLDLFVPVGAWKGDGPGLNKLLRNDRGVFHDVAREAGLTDSLPTDNAIWLDYDRDGHIDLYTGNLAGSMPELRNRLYRNNGDGTFADETTRAGLDVSLQVEFGGSNGGMAAGDFNDDGWPDLYVGCYENRNRLFLNDGEGGFLDVTTGEIGDIGEAFGIAVGDLENDGDLDIFQAAGGGDAASLQRSLMLLNLGDGQFLDVTEAVGLAALGEGQALGVGLADVDNDGDTDFLTGFPHFLFLNNGDGTFTDATARSGIADVALTVSFGDYDRNGFLDAWFGNRGDYWTEPFGGKLFRNNGNDNHWLQVELIGIESNRSGIGARLIATSGELRQMREILGGKGYEQDELMAHFGLGQRTQVDELEIRWPSGQVDALKDIPADQRIRVFEGREGFHVAQPAVWESESDSLLAGSTTDFEIAVRPALFEKGARITRVAADLSEVGGPAEKPLVDAGDGIYRLEPVEVDVGEAEGYRAISVAVDQSTSLGLHWTQMTKSVLVLAGEDRVIFADALGDGWEGDFSVNTKPNPEESGTVHQGQKALAIDAASFLVEFSPLRPVAPAGYKALHFAFHPGEATASFARFSVVLNDYRLELLGAYRGEIGLDMERKEWQVVEIPLGAFGYVGSTIESIRLWGNLRGVFFLDDIRLVAATLPPASTAVMEARTAALPESFALGQNFPNPFNGETEIRFFLPAAGEVELSVFSLAGQRVARLVQGMRQVGAHAIRWDGRDDDGRALASAVYLYRLKIGTQQVMARKLVLLR